MIIFDNEPNSPNISIGNTDNIEGIHSDFFVDRNKKFLEYKETLPKEPTDDNAKKEYVVGCYSAEDWEYIHEVLTTDGTLEDNIPSYSCECCNDCLHSETRGIYLLSDEEAQKLINHSRVKYVNINLSKYPGTYLDSSDKFICASKFYRYSDTVKHERYPYNTMYKFLGSHASPSSNEKNRGSYQLKRFQQKNDPWYTASNPVPSGNTYNLTITDTAPGILTVSGSDRNGVVSGENPTITIFVGDTLNLNFNLSGTTTIPSGNTYPDRAALVWNYDVGSVVFFAAANNIISTSEINENYIEGTGTITYSPIRPPKAQLKYIRYNNDSILENPPANMNHGGFLNVIGTQNVNVFNDRVQQYGDGSDVDIIVCDVDMWFGHIEFQNNLGGPTSYRGGNKLPGNGTCDLLDLVLDAPYYLDPDFFNADSSNRLMTRWDGTIVPVESFSRNWWGQNSTLYRSSKFVSPSNGGTATGNNDFGVIAISSTYTRSRCNGSNTAYQTDIGFHGTPCASQAYGRQYGWAFNANKWFLNLYGRNGVLWEAGFDLQKVFHQVKPINPTYGTKDPTVSSNSWGLRENLPNSGYYYFRTNDSVGTYYFAGYNEFFQPVDTRPGFFKYHYETTREFLDGHSILTAGEELVNSGVIFVCASGNNNQQIVRPNHPNHSNYRSDNNNTTFQNSYSLSSYSSFPHNWYYSTNRIGFPGQIGADKNLSENNYRYSYKTISIGALDNEYSSTGRERKVWYSNMGNAVDIFAPGHHTIAACDNNWERFVHTPSYERYDSTYTLNGQQSLSCRDVNFSGTSSATPIFVGLLASKLQYNRSWTYRDVKDWIHTSTRISLSEYDSQFYYNPSGDHTAEAYPADYPWWSDYNALQGHLGYIAYDAPTGYEPDYTFGTTISDTSPIEGSTITISIATNAPNGTYYYSIEPSFQSTITASDFTSNSLTGSFSITNGTGVISLTLASDGIIEENERFILRIRTGSVSGAVVATSDYISAYDVTFDNRTSFFETFGDVVRFSTGNGLVFRGVTIKYT
ncbi:MAG: hypothetical protein EBU90_18775 [Proteobacteria bacterium]|nr:hypothetical protein [Pseudomonadota bacterium]NBP15949.1 hypothetical protein [bacterium]